jgi:hypothetical protein
VTELEPRSARVIWSEWVAANEADDRDRAGVLAEEMTRSVPDSFHAWFEAGLHSKAVRDWPTCAERNSRALDLFTAPIATEFDGANPAAWNLGIAATALGDWPTARRAWTAYGIAGLETGLDTGSDPIDRDYGLVPIRVNPDRPSLSVQDIPAFGATEVVWCWRRSPAHAVVASVPLPESGHRFRDVVLHDGEPKGTRRHGDAQVSVFDELDKLQDSAIPTWQAVVEGATIEDVAYLGDIAGPRGLGADNWSGIRLMCAGCSHCDPDTTHQHTPAHDEQAVLGLAGNEAQLRDCLTQWQHDRPMIGHVDLHPIWT